MILTETPGPGKPRLPVAAVKIPGESHVKSQLLCTWIARLEPCRVSYHATRSVNSSTSSQVPSSPTSMELSPSSSKSSRTETWSRAVGWPGESPHQAHWVNGQEPTGELDFVAILPCSR
jgi:hypothetical protein